MAKHQKNKTYIRTGFLLIVIGVIGLSFPFLSLGFLSDFAFLNTVAENNGPAVSLNDQFIGNGSSGKPFTPTPDYERSSVKNRLVIANTGINMPVFLSNDANVLFKGGWMFPNTSTPDKGSNTVIFGHRFRYLPPVSNTFYHLDKIKVGDSFTLTWQDKTYTYKVNEVKIIEPTDLSVLQPSTDTRVTLITCAPLFSTKQRLTVVGILQ